MGKGGNNNKPKYPSWTNDALPDKTKMDALYSVASGHVDSFDYAIGDGLKYAVNDIEPKSINLSDGLMRVWLENVQIHQPKVNETGDASSALLYPSECRERHVNYGGKLTSVICLETPAGVFRVNKNHGTVPIMVRSRLCNLAKASPKEMVKRHEDATELGGYFICNGIERVIRMLQIPRRNHIMAMQRPSFKKRGPMYTDKAVTIRCVGPDQTGANVTLHYLTNGTATVKIGIRKAEYFIPVILLLKALKGPMTTDKEIYTSILRGAHLDGDTFISDRVELCIQQISNLRLYTAKQCRQYLGSQFRTVLNDASDELSDEECGNLLIRKHIFRHLNRFTLKKESNNKSSPNSSSAALDSSNGLTDKQIEEEKFILLIEMIRKLFGFVSGKFGADNPDALNNHELLTGGHLMLSIMKERLEGFLFGLTALIKREIRTGYVRTQVKTGLLSNDPMKMFRKYIDRQAEIGPKLFYFLSTGNLISESGLELMQTAGFTVVGEKLNRYRFLSHFRAVHRGQFFTTMKTTAVRKLLPESWGFLCPVHTPDGTPCGLLNHLSALCAIVSHKPPNADNLSGFSEAAIAASSLGSKSVDTSSAKKKRRKSRSGMGTGTTTSITPTLISEAGNMTLLSALAQLIKNLCEWGVTPAGPRASGIIPPYTDLPVLVDGRVVGHAPHDVLVKKITPRLRRIKVTALRTSAAELLKQDAWFYNTAKVVREFAQDPHGHYMSTLEVCMIPESTRGGACPGLYLFTDPARMLRPVVHLETGLVELIGPMEQTFLEIAVRPEEVRIGIDTHCEIWPTSMLSLIASLTPFSDFNQSPRNMYQCQMGKQTMGTPMHNYIHRPDNKLYRIQTPQAPLVQCKAQSVFSMDEYPNGTNAIVAVISYTGYDMEDAMILNKSSYERGFAHASVYKTKVLDLSDSRSNEDYQFCNMYPDSHPSRGRVIVPSLGLDGLPELEQRVEKGDPIAVSVDSATGQVRIEKFKETEPAFIDKVRLLGIVGGKKAKGFRKASITFRFNRNPVVGDKFSSRHGQKGVMSILWPQEDMPFSESGMTPDVIINPHAFPSRMTIGMLIESMAGKAGALHGTFQDSTPFTMQGDTPGQTAVDYFGEQLRAAGYNYYGSEPLYSGIQGTEMRADIYLGLVYYQRLRHMVSDKSQVRSLGPIDSITRQPVKGRKRQGGVRFGEMERDSLLAHGTSFLMRDRLLNCSDKHTAFVCCGSLLGIHTLPPNSSETSLDAEDNDDGLNEEKDGLGSGSSLDVDVVKSSSLFDHETKFKCRVCGRGDKWNAITVPYVFRYLVNELAAMGIKLELS